MGIDLDLDLVREQSVAPRVPEPTPTTPAEDGRRALAAIRRRWLISVDVLLVTFAAVFVFSHLGPVRYEATAQILLQQPDQVNAVLNPEAITSAANVQREVNTNAQLITSSPVVDAVRRRLGLSGTTRELSRRLAVTGEATSNLVEITARDTSPRVAAEIATAVAKQYQAYRRRSAQDAIGLAVTAARARLNGMDSATQESAEGQALEARLHQLETGAAVATGGVQVVRPAAVPTSAASRLSPLSLAVAILLALALAALAVVVAELLDRRLLDEEAVEDAFGLPVIGDIPPARPGERHERARSAAFETLAGRLRFGTGSVSGRVLMVAPVIGFSDDDTALRLVESLADIDPRVLLVDADFRRPRSDPGVEGGLADVLRGVAAMDDEVVVVSESADAASRRGRRWELLAAGRCGGHPAAMLSSPEMAGVLAAARGRADDVIVAAPPLDRPASALGLATLCDAILIVVREKATTRDEARAVRAALTATATPVIGIALEREPVRRRLPRRSPASSPRRRRGWRRTRPEAA
jgi:capsular polysaccharide biosynthesis protein